MNIEFELWRKENGKSYVEEFIKGQGDKIASEMELIIFDLQKVPFLNLLRLEDVKKIKGDIYEIRLRIRKINYRILFLKKGNTGWLLEAFIKKSNKTPIKYIETAEQRAKEI